MTRDLYSCTPADTSSTQAERTARRAAFRDALRPAEPGPDLGAIQRATTYAAHRGDAASWPIPLTPCR